MVNPATYRPAPGTIPTEPGVYKFRDGAGRVLNPPLTLNERDGLTASAQRLRQVARDLGF